MTIRIASQIVVIERGCEMPLYPFTCNECGHSFDALIARPVADPTAECPGCGSRDVARGFGVPAQPIHSAVAATNCRGDGPPCGAVGCGRVRATG